MTKTTYRALALPEAKRAETRDKRINQMLDELAEGGIYMGMRHQPSQR